MGFELNTYHQGELASMYWYLQYLAKTRISHLERIRGFTIRSHSSSRSKERAEERKQYTKALSFINFSTLEVSKSNCLLTHEALSEVQIQLLTLI
jgi:hypothetical protein